MEVISLSWSQICHYKSFVFVLHQEADLVTTHELGHNFGAEHDPDNIRYCAPSDDQGGKFVMYPIAVSGDHVNNKVQTRQKCSSTSAYSTTEALILWNIDIIIEAMWLHGVNDTKYNMYRYVCVSEFSTVCR